MLVKWMAPRHVRLPIAGLALVGGFGTAELLLRSHSGFALLVAIFSIGLATLVGAGKLASP